MRAALVVLFVALLGFTPPDSVSNTAAATARECRERHHLQGMVCAIVGKEGLREIGADGLRRRAAKDAITVDDRMHLGSCTKAFTATLAAVLVADGTLRWDSTVGEVLGPQFPTLGAEWKPVTLEQLLRHRGGAPAEPEGASWGQAFQCKATPRECRAAFLAPMLAGKPAQSPGTYVYSNQGYALAGHMIEVAAGGADRKGYEEILTERVLKPLGITRAGFGPPSRIEPASPQGHDQLGVPYDGDNPNAIAPAGLLHMPLGDWARFVSFHLGGTPPKELEGAAKLLPKLHEPSANPPKEALGWITANREWGGAVLTHAGSNTKWFCVAWLAPEKGVAVLAAVNQGGDRAPRACDEACTAMIRAIAPPK